MKEKNEISVIIPVHELTDETRTLFNNAVKSVEDQFVTPDALLIIVPKGSDVSKELKDFDYGKIKDIGELLKYQWNRKRQLTDTVTNDYIDNIYNKAINAGAYGGKLMGAGGGGFFMFLAPPDTHEKIKPAAIGCAVAMHTT